MTTKNQPCLSFKSACQVWAYVDTLDMWQMRLGLDRVKSALKALQNPQNKTPSIHLVGTNGKGSTSAILSALYQAAGLKTGLFTSPHLCHVSERIQIAGQPLPEAALLQAANAVGPAINPQDPLTYFEFLTVLAFVAFQQQGVELALIEAGLGGRLDSTNVIEAPLAVVVTPISLDHQDRLGEQLTQIAAEKAAVFRPGVPVICAPQAPEARDVVCCRAKETQSPLMLADSASVTLGPLTVSPQEAGQRQVTTLQGTFEFSLLGRYQQHNLAVALQTVEALSAIYPLSRDALCRGLLSVRWPGRFDWNPRHQWVIDGSHNEAGIEALLETLVCDFSDTPIDWGLSLLQNRSPQLLKPLLAYPQTRSVTWIEAEGGHPFHTSQSLLQEAQGWVSSDIPQAVGTLSGFLDQVALPGALRVLTGSLYMVGEALRLYQE